MNDKTTPNEYDSPNPELQNNAPGSDAPYRWSTPVPGNAPAENSVPHSSAPAPEPAPAPEMPGSSNPAAQDPRTPPHHTAHPAAKFVAVALVCTLLGGIIGGAVGSFVTQHHLDSTTTLQQSNRVPPTVNEIKVDGKTRLSNAENYKTNVNSVVSINVGTQTNFFGQIVEQPSSGSGFILTADGYIMTNFHVVKDASTIKVTTYDGTTYDAAYIGGDEDYDIAVIKILAKDLPAVVIGDSTAVQVGDDVVAIGNPLGELTFSLTSGSVSSANRAITVGGSPFNMIQINCAINPGNSGGPLLNAYGEVIGVVSAKYSTYGNTTVEGVGFAIPISDVYGMVKDIIENGYVTNKAYFGIRCDTVDRQVQIQYNLPIDKGVYVHEIIAGGPAESSGLRKDDIILKVNDTPINTREDLVAVQRTHRSGDTVKLTVYRGSHEITLDFTFGAMPEPQGSQAPSKTPSNNQSGNSSMTPNDFFSLFPFLF